MSSKLLGYHLLAQVDLTVPPAMHISPIILNLLCTKPWYYIDNVPPGWRSIADPLISSFSSLGVGSLFCLHRLQVQTRQLSTHCCLIVCISIDFIFNIRSGCHCICTVTRVIESINSIVLPAASG